MRAIILNLTAHTVIPINYALAKYLASEIHILQIIWTRHCFTVLLMLPVMYFFFNKDLVWTEKPKLQLLRGLVLLGTNISFYYAVSHIPLAKALTLTFISPLVVTVLSAIFLSEKVGIKRWSAVFLGFIGMVLIVQPAFIELNYYYISPIIFCIFFACVAISVRSLSKTEANYTIAFYFTFLCMIIGLCSMFFVDWIVPTKIDFLIFVVMGLCGSIANLLLTQSYRLSEASLVTPIKYLSLVFAILFGFFIWNEVPKALTLVGAALVVLSSLIIFVRESQLKKQIITPRA